LNNNFCESCTTAHRKQNHEKGGSIFDQRNLLFLEWIKELF